MDRSTRCVLLPKEKLSNARLLPFSGTAMSLRFGTIVSGMFIFLVNFTPSLFLFNSTRPLLAVGMVNKLLGWHFLPGFFR